MQSKTQAKRYSCGRGWYDKCRELASGKLLATTEANQLPTCFTPQQLFSLTLQASPRGAVRSTREPAMPKSSPTRQAVLNAPFCLPF
jgi:hypothetical protein